jgi:curved DNA-binding protein CbpA
LRLKKAAREMPGKTHYETLGVRPDASLDKIKRAFRELALQWHPDRNRSPDAAARFKEINAAYECLKDARRRADYDRTLEREREWARREPPKSESKAKTSNGSASAKKDRTKEPPSPRRKPRGEGEHPPYAMFACALAALIGWWWVAPVLGAEPAAAAAPPQQPASPARHQRAATPSPEESEEQQLRLEAKLDRAEIQSLNAEIARLREELARQQQAQRSAQSQSQMEGDALRTEIERLRAEVRKQDEIRQAADARIHSEKTARWDALTERLFGMPFQDGSPCDMPTLSGQRCYNVQINAPQTLAFTFGQGARQQFEVSVSASEWRVISNRWTPAYAKSFRYDRPYEWEPSLSHAGYQLLQNLGFSREMLAQCIYASYVTHAADYEYRCRHLDAPDENVMRVSFTVRPRTTRR